MLGLFGRRGDLPGKRCSSGYLVSEHHGTVLVQKLACPEGRLLICRSLGHAGHLSGTAA